MAELEDLDLGKLMGHRRRTVSLAAEELVRRRPLFEDQALPSLIEPAVAGVDLAAWAAANKELVESELSRAGGILFRGFDLPDVAAFQGVIRALYGELLEYSDRVQPRTVVSSKIYSSTEYPPDQHIELHNESAYAATWPLRIAFFCMLPSETGGQTPIADCRRVLARIPAAVGERFRRLGVMYVRNFGDGFGISWQTAFQTDDRAEMEEFCRKNGVSLEWKEDGRLRTRSVRPVVVRHPGTGEMVWFNAAVSSHISTVEPKVREALLSEFATDELPKNSFWGDGSELEPEVLAELREAYRAETVAFLWQRGDVLLLDNMLAAHGRAPYTGPRKLVVGMAMACNVSDVEA
ncbi:MAG TPA: TauD/TfdA family dioxygenase [Thermoanaerobaculia bacterium]|nr:TauD/TfdA family dioxygenase [Thermoanaerobaculia bacterium]